MIEIEKRSTFYEQSGGMTLSGGEVMNQIEFAQELIETAKDKEYPW